MGGDGAPRRPCEGQCNGPWIAPAHETRAERERREFAASEACSRCPIEIECLADALRRRDHRRNVVLGGLNGDGRNEIIEELDRVMTHG